MTLGTKDDMRANLGAFHILIDRFLLSFDKAKLKVIALREMYLVLRKRKLMYFYCYSISTKGNG
jgi:hypothetical protein